jgi:protein N-terminal amidase
VSPFLEHPRTGPTSLFCSELATQLNCYVVAGYPEKIDNEDQCGTTFQGSEEMASLVGSNSSVIYGPEGWVGGYRKTHLYEEDKYWAKPGELS